VTFHFADFRDYAKEASADFDLVVHLAAVVGGRMTIEGDPLAVATDLAIDATLFNWLVKQKQTARKLLYFSSSAAYPIGEQTQANNRPLAEELIDFDSFQLGMPDMTYGWSKLTGEFLARHAAEKYGLNVVTYRPFSGYGEDQDFTYPFPSVVRRVGQGEAPIIVWGSGEQLRDFIYIDDAVEAVFASADKLQPAQGRGRQRRDEAGRRLRARRRLPADVRVLPARRLARARHRDHTRVPGGDGLRAAPCPHGRAGGDGVSLLTRRCNHHHHSNA
jgi:nucleoside-diphosphate-sugar epimerase